MKTLRLGLFILSCMTLTVFAGLENPNDYIKTQKPFAEITNGSVVQGSVENGGMQPDYQIDMEAPELQPLWKYAQRIKKSHLSYWEKIEKITKYISSNILPRPDYDDKAYLALIKSYKVAKKNIPLSRYAACGAGVCRENAILTHLALKEAGIDNKHVYAKIHRISVTDKYNVVEDHAFTVVEHEGTRWVVDSYYWAFNGFKLDDLLSPEGITKESLHAPIAKPGPTFRRIIKINNFPTIWVPKNEVDKLHNNKSSCEQLFR